MLGVPICMFVCPDLKFYLGGSQAISLVQTGEFRPHSDFDWVVLSPQHEVPETIAERISTLAKDMCPKSEELTIFIEEKACVLLKLYFPAEYNQKPIDIMFFPRDCDPFYGPSTKVLLELNWYGQLHKVPSPHHDDVNKTGCIQWIAANGRTADPKVHSEYAEVMKTLIRFPTGHFINSKGEQFTAESLLRFLYSQNMEHYHQIKGECLRKFGLPVASDAPLNEEQRNLENLFAATERQFAKADSLQASEQTKDNVHCNPQLPGEADTLPTSPKPPR